MLRPWISVLALVAGALHIRAEYDEERPRAHLLRPLATGMLLLTALLSSDPVSPFYRGAVAAGLLFSLAGDLVLLLPDDRFLAGLITSSFSYLAYILAFSGEVRGVMPLPLGIPFLLYAGALYLLLSTRLDRQRFALMFYTILMSVMAWSAFGQLLLFRDASSASAAIGASLLLLSGSLLIWNHFRRRLPWAQFGILGSYYLGQLLIALSV